MNLWHLEEVIDFLFFIDTLESTYRAESFAWVFPSTAPIYVAVTDGSHDWLIRDLAMLKWTFYLIVNVF